MTATLTPVVFDAPLVNPAPNGLVAATSWVEEDGPLRWLPSGVDFRVFNYGGGTSFGVWAADWCAAEADLDPVDDVKRGVRPIFPESFLAMTTWAADECDLRAPSRDEVRLRAQQTHRLQEPNAVEAQFSARLLTDGGTPGTAANLVAAVGILEGKLAQTNTLGVIHASAAWAAPAALANLIIRTGGALKTPLGHQWVFGGGYVTGLGATLVATSPVFGWRGPVQVNDAPSLKYEEFLAVAERSLVVGYEAAVGAVTVS